MHLRIRYDGKAELWVGINPLTPRNKKDTKKMVSFPLAERVKRKTTWVE